MYIVINFDIIFMYKYSYITRSSNYCIFANNLIHITRINIYCFTSKKFYINFCCTFSHLLW